jgi:hypothetical protein
LGASPFTNYQRRKPKSNHKFEVVGEQELLVRVPLPLAEVWAEMQAHEWGHRNGLKYDQSGLP